MCPSAQKGVVTEAARTSRPLKISPPQRFHVPPVTCTPIDTVCLSNITALEDTRDAKEGFLRTWRNLRLNSGRVQAMSDVKMETRNYFVFGCFAERDRFFLSAEERLALFPSARREPEVRLHATRAPHFDVWG